MLLKTEKWLSFLDGLFFKLRICFLDRMIFVPILPPLLPFHTSFCCFTFHWKTKTPNSSQHEISPFQPLLQKKQEEFPMIPSNPMMFLLKGQDPKSSIIAFHSFSHPVSQWYRCHPSIQKKTRGGNFPKTSWEISIKPSSQGWAPENLINISNWRSGAPIRRFLFGGTPR